MLDVLYKLKFDCFFQAEPTVNFYKIVIGKIAYIAGVKASEITEVYLEGKETLSFDQLSQWT